MCFWGVGDLCYNEFTFHVMMVIMYSGNTCVNSEVTCVWAGDW